MFWTLLLAHYAADYPLQPNWMARNKTRFWVLLLHVTVHFVVMAALLWPVFPTVWPFLVLLTAIHFGMDMGKIRINHNQPTWVAAPYLIDQGLHLLSIGLVAAWIGRVAPSARSPVSQGTAVILVGFLLATYVWLITEKVLSAGQSKLPGGSRAWSRLLVRASLLAVLLLGWRALGPYAASLVIQPPYPANRQGARALLIDTIVVVLTALLVILAGQ